jgi:hypothetical protein
MKSHYRFFLLYLFITVTGFFATLIVTKEGQAVQQVCNRNPGQEANTSTLRSNSAKVQGYVIKVELRYNSSTKEKWSRACIPSETLLYLKDKNGRTYGEYSAQINGWNYGDKVRTSNPMKACAKHPNDPREFCTTLG